MHKGREEASGRTTKGITAARKDMTGVPRRIIEHTLNDNPSVTLVSQKRKTYKLGLSIGIKANNSIKNDTLAALYGKYNYKEGLIDQIYESESTRFSLQGSKALFSNPAMHDSDSDIEEDERRSSEFLADLNAEYHERALLANQRRFYKRSGRVGASKKPMDRSNETCIAFGKLGHFQKDCPSIKTSTPSYPSTNKSYNKPKFQTNLTPQLNQSINNNQKDYKVKYKGLKAEIDVLTKKIDAINKGKSEKGDEKPSVGRADARSGQWVQITEKFLLTLMEEVKGLNEKIQTHLEISPLTSQSESSSGCSRHMTRVKQYLHRYSKESGPKVVFGDNSLGDTEGYGSVNCNGITFTKVAYVNGLKHNLISISQLCDDNFKVLFTKNQGTIFNQNNEVVLIAPRRRDVYIIDMTSYKEESNACFFAKASPSINWLWHKRLSYLNFKNINKLAKQNLVVGLPSLTFPKDKTCSACEKGKHHRASFKTKRSFSINKCLHLLHMDLFGPVKPQSIIHNKYTFVIVDEYSRYTWVFCLKKKSDSADCIISFIKRMENLNEVKVKELRSDNRTVFRNHKLEEFCDDKGISQNFSSPCTPKQNGGEAVNTACYTQNRSIIVKRHGKTTYDVFRGRSPNISYFHVFGCPVHIDNHRDHLRKFDDGFFLGYSPVTKAFRVLNIRRQEMEETYHVTFSEDDEAISQTSTESTSIKTGSDDENPPPPTQQAPHTVSTIKLPILKKGNGHVNVSTDTNGQIKVLPPKTTEEILARERERKAMTTLLMAIPEDHLAKFHKMIDAKEMWEAIKSRFGGNDESKKMQKYILKQQFESFSISNSEGLHKGYDRFQSLLSQLDIHGAGVSTEDANQKFLRVFKSDVKGSTGLSSSAQNVAFVSSESTSSTNDVSTAYGVFTSSGYNSQRKNSSSYTDELIYSFFANQSSGPQLDHEDLEQLDEFDLEEMDLKWQVAMISIRLKKFYKKTGRKLQFDAKEPVGFDKTKVECFNCHKTGHFAREYRSKGNQDTRRRDAGNTWYKAKYNGRRPRKQKEPKALVTLDGEGVDWTSHAEDEQENFALMAYSNSGLDTEDKSGLGYGDQIHEGVLSYENEVFQSVFDSRSSDVQDSLVYDRFANVEGMHAVPPLMTGNYMPLGPDREVDDSIVNLILKPVILTLVKPILMKNIVLLFAFVNTVKHVKTPRETVKEQNTCSQSPQVDKRDWNVLMSKKLGLGYGFTRKAYFVCGSFSHLIRDCDFYEKRIAKQVELNKKNGNGTGQRENRPVWNNVQRLNHQNKFVPKAVLTKTGIFSANIARQNLSSQAATTSTARKVNTAKPIVNEIRPRNNFYKSHSPIKRPFNRTTAPKANFSNQKVNIVRVKAVSVVGGIRETAVKPSAVLKNKWIVDSGCSKHMTGNKAYLVEYQDYNGGLVAFGGSKGYITGKDKIKTGKLNFEDVCFVKELQHFNLFFVSQMCDKKNKVLFTDAECLVLSSDSKLPDKNQVLLRIPRQNNMYSFNLENIVPTGDLACLIAKATVDESNK
ncbi:ribonuclease H-like domain-containing protein [Tanacetum coccineum]